MTMRTRLIQSSGMVAGWLTLTIPAQAMDVKIEPDNPQLGETVSVVVETDQPTTKNSLEVRWGQQSYPVFELENNQYRTLIPTTPLDDPGEMTLTVSKGETVKTFDLWLRDRDFPTQHIQLSGDGVEPTQLELDRIDQFKQLVTPEKHWEGTLVRPSEGSVSTVFGVRRYYNGDYAENYYHRGVDYASPRGSAVVAPAGGEVVLVGTQQEGFRLHGNTIGIDHGQGLLSIFLHLHDIKVQQGEAVTAGETIGTVGATGISTGPHLHWGLYVNGKAVDPVPWRFEGIQ